TDNPPAGACRRVGVYQSAWAVESEMDIIAAALKMDPLEIRRKNGYNEGDEFVTGETLRSVGLKECVDEVAKSIEWEARGTDRQGAEEIPRQGGEGRDRG